MRRGKRSLLQAFAVLVMLLSLTSMFAISTTAEPSVSSMTSGVHFALQANVDNDGDSFTEEDTPADCDDANDQIFPGATEVENNLDDNCDGSIDEGTSSPDLDGDGVDDDIDNCDDVDNPNQDDADNDNVGDACDPLDNSDTDTIPDVDDNCDNDDNEDQANQDGDSFGDVCDPDIDGDGFNNGPDNCDVDYNPDQTNTDGLADGGDACDPDDDVRRRRGRRHHHRRPTHRYWSDQGCSLHRNCRG